MGFWNRIKLVARRETPVVADFDAMVVETIRFRYNGKIHEIPPLELVHFLAATNALAVMDQLRKKEKITSEELISGYEGVFSAVCPTIKRRDIEKMSQHQVAALYNLILETIMGKAQVEREKKNTEIPTDQIQFQTS